MFSTASSVTTVIQSPVNPDSLRTVSLRAHSSRAPYSVPKTSRISSQTTLVLSSSQPTLSATTRIICLARLRFFQDCKVSLLRSSETDLIESSMRSLSRLT